MKRILKASYMLVLLIWTSILIFLFVVSYCCLKHVEDKQHEKDEDSLHPLYL